MGHAKKPPKPTLKTTRLGFSIWWIAIMLLHLVNIAYYVGVVVFYKLIWHTNLDYQLQTYAIGISRLEYDKVSAIHLVIAILHGIAVLAMVLGSIQARKLAFHPDLKPYLVPILTKLLIQCGSTRRRSKSSHQPSDGSRRSSSIGSFSKSAANTLIARGSAVFGRDGVLGVDSVYFDHLHLARELVETLLQTIQAYRMTFLLTRVWLIRFYVLLLILNCWSTPFLHRYYKNSHQQRRMASLLCDAVLDMVSSIGVSMWIFGAYAPQYTDPVWGFPFNNWFDDVWFTNMMQEFQMMLVVSWADMASRVVFAIGLLQCMEMIKEMLTPVDGPKPGPHIKPKAQSGSTKNPIEDRVGRDPSYGCSEVIREPQVVEGPTAPPEDKVKSPKQKVSWMARIIHFVLHIAGPGWFVLWGLGILIIHIVSEASHSSSLVPCRLRLHPWFVHKPGCSLVELDCNKLGGIPGTETAMREAWSTYEYRSTARLVIRHCPQLEMPSTIQRFGQLTTMKIYNSSIVAWPENAAFDGSIHSTIRAVYFIRTFLPNSSLPPGLVGVRFPSTLISVFFSITNLQTLPANLPQLWPKGMALSFENTLFTAFPDPIFDLQPTVLSFAGSPITTVPAKLFENQLLQVLILSYTRIQELPRVVHNPSLSWYLLFLQGTNVSTFWSWMDHFIGYSMFLNKALFNAFDTPYCNELRAISAKNISDFSTKIKDPSAADLASIMDVSTPNTLSFAQHAVVCDPGAPFYYPVFIDDALSSISK